MKSGGKRFSKTKTKKSTIANKTLAKRGSHRLKEQKFLDALINLSFLGRVLPTTFNSLVIHTHVMIPRIKISDISPKILKDSLSLYGIFLSGKQCFSIRFRFHYKTRELIMTANIEKLPRKSSQIRLSKYRITNDDHIMFAKIFRPGSRISFRNIAVQLNSTSAIFLPLAGLGDKLPVQVFKGNKFSVDLTGIRLTTKDVKNKTLFDIILDAMPRRRTKVPYSMTIARRIRETVPCVRLIDDLKAFDKFIGGISI